MIKQYRKKPVTIEAVQWTGQNFDEVKAFVGDALTWWYNDADWQILQIRAIDDDHFVRAGDYIIKDVKGEFYPCKPDIFAQTYEDAEKQRAADVAPVVHGRWEAIDASTWRWSHDGARPVHRVKYRHNECRRVVQKKEPYCPRCGAKMDGGVNNG